MMLMMMMMMMTTGAHNPERATSMRSCHGGFHGPVNFLNDFGLNFQYLLNSTNESAKPTDLKNFFFCLLMRFSFFFGYLIL